MTSIEIKIIKGAVTNFFRQLGFTHDGFGSFKKDYKNNKMFGLFETEKDNMFLFLRTLEPYKGKCKFNLTITNWRETKDTIQQLINHIEDYDKALENDN